MRSGSRRRGRSSFTGGGFCNPCQREVAFRVDYQAGGNPDDGPNWRERMVCPSCHMSNRQRLIASLVWQEIAQAETQQRIYLMEQTTPLYIWMRNRFKAHSITGSEYFGKRFESGTLITPFDFQASWNARHPLRSLWHRFILSYAMIRMGGIVHEDATGLSFGDKSLNIVVSDDVFEHIPSPEAAFAECARVLKPGGILFATIPFHSAADASVTRARVDAGEITHFLPETYHGNPISDRGSLVYTDFGWDIIDTMDACGFANTTVEVYRDVRCGHLGTGLLVFRALR